MSTRAVVGIGSKYFDIPSDGYPEAVIPDLVSLLEKAKDISEKTGRDVLQELSLLIYEDDFCKWEPVTELVAAGIPSCYEYAVEEDGIVVATGDADEEDIEELIGDLEDIRKGLTSSNHDCVVEKRENSVKLTLRRATRPDEKHWLYKLRMFPCRH